MSPNSGYFSFMAKPSTRPNCQYVHANPTKRLRDLISELITGPHSGLAFSDACLCFVRAYSFIHGTQRFFRLPEYFFNFLKAPKTKNTNPSGLGRAIINRRTKDARQTEGSGLVRSGRISIEGSQPCLLVHNRHRTILSFAICHPGKRSRRILEYGTIGRHRIYCR
jgi:hypothetical protein